MNLSAYRTTPKPQLCRECITCTPPEHDNRIIAFSDYFKIILHPDQTSIGSIIVASIRHVGRICDFKETELTEFGKIISAVEPTLEHAFGADLINIYYQRNWAYRIKDPDPPFKQGKPNPHVHMHVIPRYSKKITFENEEWIDTEFGEPFIYRNRMVSENTKLKIIRRIQSRLNPSFK